MKKDNLNKFFLSRNDFHTVFTYRSLIYLLLIFLFLIFGAFEIYPQSGQSLEPANEGRIHAGRTLMDEHRVFLTWGEANMIYIIINHDRGHSLRYVPELNFVKNIMGEKL